MKRITILAVLFVLVLTLLRCSPSGTEQQSAGPDSTSAGSKPEMIKILVLKPQMIGKTLEYSSTLTPFEEVHLAPSTPGRIEEINAEIGDHVKKDQVHPKG